MEFEYTQADLMQLKTKDSLICDLIDKYGYLTREIEPNVFKNLIQTIIGQQISGKAAITILNRLENVVTEISYENLRPLSLEEFQSAGVSERKAKTIQSLLNQIENREINLDNLNSLSDQEVIDILIKIKGIGEWSAQMILMFSLNRKNVFSVKDLGIVRGLKWLYRENEFSEDQLNAFVNHFSPYGSIASIYLWKLSEGENKFHSIYHGMNTSYFPINQGVYEIITENEQLISLSYRQDMDVNSLENKPLSLLHQSIHKYLTDYFDGKPCQWYGPIKVKGTLFQEKVWRVLREIPYGKTWTYQEVASRINPPSHPRAVGQAIGKNPLSILVPCHRVIGKNGTLTGYADGVGQKEFLLNLEKGVK